MHPQQPKTNKKFIDSFLEFTSKLTYEKFKSNYLKITEKMGSPFVPEDSILKHYYEFIKNLTPNFGEGDILGMVLAPRECYKTTTFSIVFPVMLIVYSFEVKNDFTLMVIGSNNFEKAKRAIFERIKYIFRDLKYQILRDDKLELQLYEDGKYFRITPIHSESDLRSYSFLHYRPQLIILDDMDKPVSKSSPQERLAQIQRFSAEWLPARMSGNSMILVVGNYESQISILKHLSKFPKIHKLELKYKDENGKYLKSKWNEEWEKDQISIMGEEEFLRQYAHELPEDKYDIPLENLVKGKRYALIDIGVEEGNFVAVLMIGKTIVDILYAGHNSYKLLIEQLQEFKPEEIYFDATANQIFLQEIFQNYFPTTPVIELYTQNINKKERMLYGLLMLEKKEINVINDDKVIEKVKQEIEKINSNSHIFDILGTFLLTYSNKEYTIRGYLI